MRRRLGLLTLASALSGLLLYVIRETRFGLVFTSGTRPIPEALLLALPGTLAVLGLALRTIPISAELHRARLGPRTVRVAAVVAAMLGVTLFLLASVAAYDQMWVMYMGPFDRSPGGPLLPPYVGRASTVVGIAFMGIWMTCTSLQLRGLRLVWPLVALGTITGLVLVATTPYLAGALIALEFALSVLWAGGVAAQFLIRRRLWIRQEIELGEPTV